MRKLLTILTLGFVLISCEDRIHKKSKSSLGPKFKIIKIEGCEFYEHISHKRYGLTKVDCNCVPDTTNRNNE